MKVEKDPKTGKWLIQYRYTDWQGKRRKSTKRGFSTKQAAQTPANGQTKTQTQKDAEKTVTMNIQFKDGAEVVAGGDYTVPSGVQNYSVLEQYVPEGYVMTVSGDFMAEDGSHMVVSIEKEEKTVIMNITFKD